MSVNALFSAASREVFDTEDASAFKAALPAVAPLESFCGADFLASFWESHLVEAANLTVSLRAVFEGGAVLPACVGALSRKVAGESLEGDVGLFNSQNCRCSALFACLSFDTSFSCTAFCRTLHIKEPARVSLSRCFDVLSSLVSSAMREDKAASSWATYEREKVWYAPGAAGESSIAGG